MKAKIGKIIGSILIFGLSISSILYCIGTIGALPHTFVGDMEFADMNQMQEFQSKLVADVKDVEGTVQSFDLTVSSPPKVRFAIFIPDMTEFQYGKTSMSLLNASIISLIFGLVILGVFGIAIYHIWIEADNNARKG